MSVLATPSPNSEGKGTGGGDMAAAGPLKVGGSDQGNKRGVRATAPPRPPASRPSFAAVATSAGESRPPPSGAATAGGACVRGIGKVRAPADGGVMRVGLSNSPPPHRPEPKRKKGGLPPPSDAAARTRPPSPAWAATRGAKIEGMRIPGSSIPAKDLRVGGRDVTADKFISAVSLLIECAAGVFALGDPARGVAASPPSVRYPNVPGSTDGGLAGRDCKSDRGGRRNVPRRSPPSSLPVGGNLRTCWGCGAAGHLLRGCPDFRGWCR